MPDLRPNNLPIRDPKTSCLSCAGLGALCCRSGTVIPLSKNEARQLQTDGTELQLFPRDEVPKSVGGPGFRRKFYQLIGDCASLLDDGTCSIYERRTRACREFVEGGFSCQILNIKTQKAVADLAATTDQTLEQNQID